MMNASRRIAICGAVFSLLLSASAAFAQTVAETPVQRQLDRIDFSISGIGQFTPMTSGTSTILEPEAIQQTPSNTLGALVELRYIRSPLVGIEFNYSYARFTENYNVSPTVGTPTSQLPYVLGVQTKVNEFSMGYVAHGPTIFGVRPFGGVGAGGIEFKPTSGGGQGLPPEVRTGFYYTVGVEQNFLSEHFGIRAQFRQLFYGAPDFNQNYLATGARSVTTEPGVGFYLRF
jgi:hypothetical protein